MSDQKTEVISFDDRSFLVDGKRKLLICGEIHYARAAREDWARILSETVALGVNTVAVYIFWNFHEAQKDVFDFSGDRDLQHFLTLCQERGLQVILRIGPYCCGEWNYGGFPLWLREEPGIVYRTFNQPFMDRVEKYFTRLFVEFKSCLATNGGPVMLVQVENEYANVGKWYGEEGVKYTQWIVDLAARLGIDVPTITCQGGTPGAIECVNGFYIKNETIEKLRARQPNAPLVWTELWPGWYDTWGFARHHRDARNIAEAILQFISRGGSGFNYYMWFGGTNFARTAMFQQCTDYGFDAPIDAYGRATAKGRYLKKLHAALAACEVPLLAGQAVYSDAGRVVTFGTDKDTAVISLSSESTTEGADGRLLPDARIKLNGTVLFDSIMDFEPEEPVQWMPVCSSDTAEWLPEPMPAARPEEPVLAAQPVEQLKLTKDQSDYCWYSTSVDVAQAGEHILRISYGADIIYCFVDGNYAGMTKVPLREWRGPTTRITDRKMTDPDDKEWAAEAEQFIPDGFLHEVSFAASAGPHRIDLLATAIGLVKGDWSISGPMHTECKGIWDEVLLDGVVLENWAMRPFLAVELSPPAASDWHPSPEKSGRLGWFRFDCKIEPQDLDASGCWRLDLSGWGKGMAFVNGRMIGRYWLLAAGGYGADEIWHPKDAGLYMDQAAGPTQQYYLVPASWLQSGSNEVVLFEEQRPGVRIEFQRRD